MLIERVNSYLFPSYKKRESKPSFGYNLPKHPVSDIREISHLTCACCGDTMIRPSKFNEFLQHFSANSKRALENLRLERYKDTGAYIFLKELADMNPRKTVKNLMQIDENKIKVQSLNQDEQFALSEVLSVAEGVTLPAPKVMKIFKKYYDHFSDNTKALLDVMDKYSESNPYKTFVEIFHNPEIIKVHQESLEKFNKRSVMDRVSVFRELQSLSSLKPEDRKYLQQVNSNALTVFNSEYYQPHIKKAMVEDLYGNFTSSLEDENLRGNIMQIIKGFSYEEPFVDKFILDSVKLDKSDMDIVKSISEELLATFEHVQLKSKDGTRAKANGIVLCKKCNNERSNVSYPLFLKFHPEMLENMQKQINRVVSFITNRKLIGYDSYPVDVKRTLLNNSDNILRINVRKFLKFYKQRALKKLEKAEAILNAENEKYDAASEKLKTVDLKLEEVMTMVRKLKKERRFAQEAVNEIASNKKASELDVYESKDNLDNITSLMDADLELNKSVREALKKKS